MEKSMFKRPAVLVVFLLCAVVIALASPAISQGKKVIGVANCYLGNYWTLTANQTVTEGQKKLGYEVIVTNAQGKTAQEKADVENMIARKVDGIVILGGEGNAFSDVAKKAWEANIPIVAVLMFLPDAVTSICGESWEGNANMGVWLVNQMHGEGKYIVMDASGWHTLEVNRRVFDEVVRWFPRIQRIGKPHEAGTADPINYGYTITKATLRAHPDLKAVYSTWGLPALGASKAIREAGKEKQVSIVCTDTDKPILAEMARKDAPPTACLGLDAYKQAKEAVASIHKALQYKTVQEARDNLPALVVVESMLMTNGNTKEDFKQKRLWTLEEVWKYQWPDEKHPW